MVLGRPQPRQLQPGSTPYPHTFQQALCLHVKLCLVHGHRDYMYLSHAVLDLDVHMHVQLQACCA